ncbi:hypothetical protein [Actinocrinis sp.]|uniref:hypothetical protein n=1 Tax=Actinocrinis sp. TaxID=1920516 RepID=UPI002D5203D2|nr:hypothetical protein [Actinocrinis sp.]HZP54973.1 hypothetical protein [Actinocrinis sp.]
MTDDTIAPSPLLDRNRVAEAITRQVRLDLDPVIARAAAKGMPVELNEEQALKVADAALAALVRAHPIAGREWLIKANQDWQWRNRSDRSRYQSLLRAQRQATDRWRGTALSGWVYLVGFAAVWQWHLSRWVGFGVIVAGLGAGTGLRVWLASRDRKREDAR